MPANASVWAGEGNLEGLGRTVTDADKESEAGVAPHLAVPRRIQGRHLDTAVDLR